MKKKDENIDATWLTELLEKEKHAGIPSIPEKLEPEQIELMLRTIVDINKRKKPYRRFVSSCAAVAAACALVLLFFLPKGKLLTIDTMENIIETYVCDSGVSNTSGQAANITSEETVYVQVENTQRKETKEETGSDMEKDMVIEDNETKDSNCDTEIMPWWRGEYRKRAYRPQGFPKECEK